MSGRSRILVIDDEPVIRDSCAQILQKHYDVETAVDGGTGLEAVNSALYDIVILDLKMPGLSGMDVLRALKQVSPGTVVIVITGHPSVESAVAAMKNGAYDFLPKPFTPDELRLIVNRAMEKRTLTLKSLMLQTEQEGGKPNLLAGDGTIMREIRNIIQKVGPTESTVLITGESGTGKELVARSIHQQSNRKDMVFVTIDCGTLTENLFESELFGHVKGAFTGAAATKPGRLELASGGTVFFDEIANIPPSLQAKLLRVIQERELTRVGGNQAIKIDLRIIAATNKNLIQEVQDGRFREDLYFRLSVVPVHLPPLRERKEDIPVLAHHFLKKYNARRKKAIKGFSQPALESLLRYEWPGNVRELENAIERAVVLTDSQQLQPEDLFFHAVALESRHTGGRTLEDVEKAHISSTLKQCGGKKARAAGILGIDRKTLRLKMRKYGLE